MLPKQIQAHLTLVAQPINILQMLGKNQKRHRQHDHHGDQTARQEKHIDRVCRNGCIGTQHDIAGKNRDQRHDHHQTHRKHPIHTKSNTHKSGKALAAPESMETREESVPADQIELFEEEPIPDTEETKVLEATEQIDPEKVISGDDVQTDEIINDQKITTGNVVGFGGENEMGQDEF